MTCHWEKFQVLNFDNILKGCAYFCRSPSSRFFTTLYPKPIVLSSGTSFTLPVTFRPLEKVGKSHVSRPPFSLPIMELFILLGIIVNSIITLCISVFIWKLATEKPALWSFCLTAGTHVCLALILFPHALCYAKINEVVFFLCASTAEAQSQRPITSCKQ